MSDAIQTMRAMAGKVALPWFPLLQPLALTPEPVPRTLSRMAGIYCRTLVKASQVLEDSGSSTWNGEDPDDYHISGISGIRIPHEPRQSILARMRREQYSKMAEALKDKDIHQPMVTKALLMTGHGSGGGEKVRKRKYMVSITILL